METVTLPGCPPLEGPRNQACTTEAPVFVSVNVNINHLLFDTCNTSVGTVVTLGCVAPNRVPSPSSHLLCQANGVWNSTVPTCPSPNSVSGTARSPEALSLETIIIIGVVCGFAALVLLIILTLSLVYYLKVRKAKKPNSSLDLPETDFYSTNPLTKRPNTTSNYYQTEINPMYSTRLWRRGAGYLDGFNPQLYSAPNRLEPHPHPPPPPYPVDRGSWSVSNHPSENSGNGRWDPNSRPRPPMNTLIYNSIRWNPENMKWHDNFNYLRDGRLPRYHMDDRGGRASGMLRPPAESRSGPAERFNETILDF